MGYIFLLMGIIGIPYALLSLRNKKNDAKKNLILALLFGIVFFIGVYEIGSSGSDQKKGSATSEELNLIQSIALTNESTQKELDHSFGLSPEEFVKSFNENAQVIQTWLRITKLNTNEGPGKDSFQYQFTETLILSGRIDKNNGNLIDVSLIGGNDGTTETMEDILAAASLLISSTQINVSDGFGDDVIKKLGLFDNGEDLSKIDNSTVVNGIKYYVLALPSIGLSFGASIAK